MNRNNKKLLAIALTVLIVSFGMTAFTSSIAAPPKVIEFTITPGNNVTSAVASYNATANANGSISIGQFVNNSTNAGDYVFTADGEPETVHIMASPPTSFTITPGTGTANAVSNYTAIVNTTGVTSLNITIPAGFNAVVPEGGEELAKIDVYNATGTHGTITITANGSDKIDVTAEAESTVLTATGIEVNYTAGATTSISCTAFGYSAHVTLTLPTESKSGSLNISVPAGLEITNGSIAIGQFVRNPADAGDYVFTADGVPETVQITTGVTSFTITPGTGTANAVSNYTAIVNTTGVTSLNITIPAGFNAVVPEGGEELAKIDVYNATGTHGAITITANGSDKIDVTAEAESTVLTAKGIEVNYTAGATTSISCTAFGYSAHVTLTLPTESKSGSLNISVPAGLEITNGSIAIGQFVRNPADAGDYVFTADGVPETVQITTGVTSFTIKPDTGTANAVSNYTAIVNTTGVTSLNITIPAGFNAVVPEGGEELAKIDVYNATGTHGAITITANGSDKIDVTAEAESTVLTATGIEVNYTAGATTSISCTAFGYSAHVTLTLPTESKSGSLNISVPAGLEITNGSIAIGQFVRNPADAGDYVFTADGVPETVHIVAPTPTPVPPTPTPVPPTPTPTPVLRSINVTPETATLDVEDTRRFNATAKDQRGNLMVGINITWTSSNETVGNVSPPYNITGLDGNASTIFTALAAGTTTIKAESGTVNVTANVTVRAEPTPTPPTIISVWPADGATNVPVTTTLIAIFSEAMNEASAEAAFSVDDVAGTFSWAGNTMAFTPSVNLAYNTAYTVTLGTGAQDLAGNPMVSDYTWSFTTTSVPDTIPPTIISVWPADGATDMSITTTISAIFSEAMNKASAEAAFSVDDVAGTFSWVGNAMAFTPSVNLAYNTAYTVTLGTGAQDLAGNSMTSDYTWSFTTTSVPDITAPTIISVWPADGATNVPVTTPLIAIFSEAMNEASAEAAFSVDDVAGTFSWAGNTMAFTPSVNLAYNTAYTVTLGTGAQDLAGNPMASDYTWSFTTESAYDVELTVDEEEKPTVAGLNATYFLTVNNIGNIPDSYMLSIDNPDSATVANLNTYTIPILVPGTTANVSLNVTNATAGTFRVNVAVVSENDPANATDFVNTTTTVGPSQTYPINESIEINALDIADTNVSINVTGPVNVTIGNYTANPGTAFTGDIGTTGKYIDVRIDNATNVDNMTIKQFYTDAEFDGMNESSLKMYWWDGEAWAMCSNTGVNTTDQDGYSGYIWAFINDSTIPSLSDLTGTPFGSAGSVLPPSVTVISPNGGEDWKVEFPHEIRWTATNGSQQLATNPVTILYSTNNGATYTTIATNEPNDGTYTWTIPSTTSTACLVKVIAEDVTGMEGFDVSDAWFTISVVVYAPGGGGPPAPPRDSDGDGISDRDEMLAGTDPNDPCDPNPECAACLAIRPPIPTPTPTAVVTPTPAVTPTLLPPAVTPTPVPTPPIPRIRMAIVIVVVVAIVAVAIIVSLAFVPWMRRRKKL